jgi:hypothetical protein
MTAEQAVRFAAHEEVDAGAARLVIDLVLAAEGSPG